MGYLSESLGAHISRSTFDSLPQRAVEAAKRTMLDTLAVAWAGSSTAGTEAAYQLAVEQGGREDSAIWAYRNRVPAPWAAFANGVSAAALDYDSFYLGIHTDGVALPAAFAMAEREHANGREMLTALVIANDLICRLGRAAQGSNRGWYFTSMFGVFGAAAATAKLLKLDAGAAASALGLAALQAAGTQQPAVGRTFAMRYQAGFAAKAGVIAGLLAARGVTAPLDAFEGLAGFFAVHQDCDAAVVVAELGERFENVGIGLKRYPCCACSHAAIEAARQLMDELDPAPEDIECAEVVITEAMSRLVGQPIAGAGEAEVIAQFSVQYGIASVLSRRRLSIDDLRSSAVADPAILQIADRIRVVVTDKVSGKFAPATVTLRIAGRTFSRTIDYMPGSAEAPLSETEVDRKVEDCLQRGVTPLSQASRRSLRKKTACLEEVDDMATFFAEA